MRRVALGGDDATPQKKTLYIGREKTRENPLVKC